MINLELNVEDVKSVLVALSKFPYEQVKELIEKIQGQATQQLQEQQVVASE